METNGVQVKGAVPLGLGSRQPEDLPACPVEITLLLIGNKWKVLVLRELRERTLRFTELKKAVEGISQKVLTANLRSMEDDGLVWRQVHAEVPPRVEYGLTELGQSLTPVLDSLAAWGEGYRRRIEPPDVGAGLATALGGCEGGTE